MAGARVTEPRLVRVEAPHFVAGLEVADGHVVRCAPILKWSHGKEINWLIRYFHRKGWRVCEIVAADPALRSERT